MPIDLLYMTPAFILDKHLSYTLSLSDSPDLSSIGKYLTEHLKMAGAYWSLTAIGAMGGGGASLPTEKKEQIVAWVVQCQNTDGGFGGNVGHDSHVTSTHYAVLVLLGLGALQKVKMEGVVEFLSGLQLQNGSFQGDKWGEVDTRFSYCAVSSLSILNALDKVDTAQAARYILKCLNFDGSFGGIPEAQSHSAYVFCCVGTLKITGHMQEFDQQALCRWLCERQTSKGGFNGRPQKLPDVCYSWWIYSTFCMMGRSSYIDRKGLEGYILECQDLDDGGISDRPGNVVDVFHTFFGLAALSLLDAVKYKLVAIDPTYAVVGDVLDGLPHLKGK